MAKILMIDDDQALCSMVQDWLKHEQHIVETVHTGLEALDQLKVFPYDIIILDWGLPDTTGIEVLKKFRSNGGTSPVIMLTGQGKITDKETGFDAGADDYITKPFDVKELTVRIRAILRRPMNYLESVISVRNITIDLAKHRVTRDGAEIKLYRREYAMLEFLLRHPERVFTAEELLDHVWKSEAGVSSETVRTSVARLRKQLDTANQPSIIESIRGFGYKVNL